MRRRSEREAADARAYAITAFARDLLSVADNLQRALENVPAEARAAEGAVKTLIEGVELTARELATTLARHGVKKLDPQGEKFDPNFHQAMFETPDESTPARHGHPGDAVRLEDRRARAAPRHGRRLQGRPESGAQGRKGGVRSVGLQADEGVTVGVDADPPRSVGIRPLPRQSSALRNTGRRRRFPSRRPLDAPGETMTIHAKSVHYKGVTGGWGSLLSIARIFGKERPSPAALETLARQNKTHGFMCVSCSWAKPASAHPFEFCENGAKATLWELTVERCAPEFFANNTVSELLEWSDYDLEQQGRLTTPMRYEASDDNMSPVRLGRGFFGDRARR